VELHRRRCVESADDKMGTPTAYGIGGTVPFEGARNGIRVGPSVEAGVSTGYASRSRHVEIKTLGMD
jgi:hypothetical protein